MKKIVCFLLVTVLLSALIFPAAAAVIQPDEPCYKKIRQIAINFSIDESTGIANCCARCLAANDVTIKITGTLQQYSNVSWVYVNSWTKTGTKLVILDELWAVYSGYKYRFIATYSIYDSNGSFVESDSMSRIYDYT